MHSFRIKVGPDSTNTTIEMGGKPLEGVYAAKLALSAKQDVPHVTLHFFSTDIEVEGDIEMVTGLPEDPNHG